MLLEVSLFELLLIMYIFIFEYDNWDQIFSDFFYPYFPSYEKGVLVPVLKRHVMTTYEGVEAKLHAFVTAPRGVSGKFRFPVALPSGKTS
jgi:hypothetical protein